MMRVVTVLALLLMAPAAVAGEQRLPFEELGEMAAGRQRLETLRAEGAAAVVPSLLAHAEERFACWTAAIDDNEVDGPAGQCRDDFLASLARMEQMAALAREPLVAEH